MLTLQEYPTRGDILINNTPIRQYTKSNFYERVPIGVCFQSDSLFDYMTVEEHLSLFLQLRNKMSPETLKKEIKQTLELSDLRSYSKRISRSLSGGNKRKLCTALSTIIGNCVIFLDEPSTGMDPGARRALWKIISLQTLQKGNTVVLTTHSMEEAESVCNRIGIMVNGQLRCLGNSQHLKSKFGGSYRLTVSLASILDTEGRSRIEMAFGHHLKLIEEYGGTLTWEISEFGSIADVFDLLESQKSQLGIGSYAVYQVNLEQVFLFHAKQQITYLNK